MNTDEIEKYIELENQANQLIKKIEKEKNCDAKDLKWWHISNYLENNHKIVLVPLNKNEFSTIIADTYGIYGLTLKDSRMAMICYNNECIETRKNFTIMHEIGHFLLHKNNQTYPSLIQENDYTEEDKIFEKEANIMAGMLLANKKAIQTLLDDRKPFNYLCKYFGISKTALKIRLFNLFYFQTLEQILNEEKEIKDLYAYSHKTINNYIYYNYKLTIN
ncbi:ImmA/IrrE family metallo-endopeptidase [Leuconostoc citreum]|uniref:ImmA/IrrE family metallo-endopeptidase n=1 Tax=Leuconostoc citreum TaxID=33964 RepID=UPI0021A93DF8|nr:ImmA/IrrE family metallo-endopeptidase [Leuconostoc citreum]MCT3070024.1 ImmA/IrrE family metallo-endopeptidase [Leuconostoc citreum]